MKTHSILKGKSQRGFTLVELLIALALTGLIAAAATMVIYQIVRGTAIANDRNTALNQVRSAAHWINHDVPMAQPDRIVVNNETDEEEFLSLRWQACEPYGDPECSWTEHAINYTLEAMSGADKLKTLWREYDGQRIFVAEYIEPKAEGVTWCSLNATEGVLSVNITATVNGRTERRSLQVITPRPDPST